MGEPDLATATYASLARIVRLLRRESESPVGPGGFAALVTLEATGPLRVGALAESQGVTAPSMTRTVSVLEAEGLVTRAADPDDGRAQLVTLTRAGADLLTSGQGARLAALRRRIEELSPDDRAALAAALPALERLGGVAVPLG